MNEKHVEFNKNDLRITNRKLDELETKLKDNHLYNEPMVIISWDYFNSMLEKIKHSEE